MLFALIACVENGDRKRTLAESQSSQVFGFLVVIKSLVPYLNIYLKTDTRKQRTVRPADCSEWAPRNVFITCRTIAVARG